MAKHQSTISTPAGQPGGVESGHEPFEIIGKLADGQDNVIRLVSKRPVSCPDGEKTTSQSPSVAWHIADSKSMSKMELRKRYPREATSHKNMLSRRKKCGAKVHADFLDFASFLRAVGPMPAKGATLDRIVNTDPEYAPGKVRWADKQTQNNNKSDTHIFHSSTTGETFTASRLAKLQSLSSDTIRKRRLRGWSDDQIISGRRTPQPTPVGQSVPHSAKFPAGLYSPYQLAIANSSERDLTHIAEIEFHREAHFRQRFREEEGEEYLIPPYEEFVEIAGDDDWGVLPTPEQYAEHFAKFWRGARPHIWFDGLSPAQRAMIEKIDPEYVERQKAKKALLATLASSL